MGLEPELAAYRAGFARTAPPGRSALYESKIQELSATFAIEKTITLGDEAPDFVLLDPYGRLVSLSDAIQNGSTVITFYRGGWCPYCNIQLRAYQAALPKITNLGARLPDPLDLGALILAGSMWTI